MERTALALTLLLAYLFSILTGAVAVDITKENTWVTLAPLPESIDGNRAVAASGKILVIGSRNFEYDPKNNKWSMIPPMSNPRAFFAIAVAQNKIFAIGGSSGQNYINATEVYDPTFHDWKNLSPIPVNISGFNAHVVNGKIYVIGGASYDTPSLSVNLVYDISNDIWMNKTTMPYPAIGYASSVVDNKIYIMGGLGYLPNREGVMRHNYTQIYDPETDSWSLGAPMPTPLSYAAAGATIGIMAPKRIYIVGGTSGGFFEGGTVLNQVYDPNNNTWSLGEAMPSSRFMLTVAVLDDQIYAIGGQDQLAFAPPSFRLNQRYAPIGYGTPDPTYDNQSPKIMLESPKNETYYSTNIQLKFSINEHAPWMGYKLDDENIIDSLGDTSISELSTGLHSLTVYAVDISGNIGASETIFFNIQEFPVLFIIAVAALPVTIVSILFYRWHRKTTNLGK